MSNMSKPTNSQNVGAILFLSCVIAAFAGALAGWFGTNGWGIMASTIGAWFISFCALAILDAWASS